jgi:nucleoside-diphosphate-sugar epimerase
VRLSEVADGLARRLGHAGGITFAPGEGPCWIAASARLRAATGWTPARGLEESLDWVAEAARAAQA